MTHNGDTPHMQTWKVLEDAFAQQRAQLLFKVESLSQCIDQQYAELVALKDADPVCQAERADSICKTSRSGRSQVDRAGSFGEYDFVATKTTEMVGFYPPPIPPGFVEAGNEAVQPVKAPKHPSGGDDAGGLTVLSIVPEPGPPPAARPTQKELSMKSAQSTDNVSTHKASSTLEQISTLNRASVAMRDKKKATREQKTILQRCVQSLAFEMVSAALILINTLMLACEIQFQGFDIGHKLGFDRYDESATTRWPDHEVFFSSCEIIFAVVFAVELLLRILANGLRAWHSFFIWLDTCLVIFSVVEITRQALEDDSAFLNPTVIRLVRLLRVARVVKMVRSLRALDSLYLIMRSIQASMGALIWSFVLLLLLQIAMGMLLFQLIRGYLDTDATSLEDLEARKEVFAYFGTFYRTTITMFEITLANWAPSCRVLIDNVSEWYGLFYIFYRCMFCFAFLKVIAAVFINETNRVTSNDEEIAIINTRKQHTKIMRKLKDKFAELDTSKDGYVEWAEVEIALEDPDMRTALEAMGLQAIDMEEVFVLFDDGGGKISLEQFTRGLARLRGQSQSCDNRHLAKHLQKIEVQISALQDSLAPSRRRRLSSDGHNKTHTSSSFGRSSPLY